MEGARKGGMDLAESHEILQGLPHRDRNLYRRVIVPHKCKRNTHSISLFSYDLFIVGIVVPIMNFLYPQNSTDAQLVNTAALIGAICGQLTFGFVADLTGTSHHNFTVSN